MYTPDQVAWGANALRIEPEMMMAVSKKEIEGKKLTFRYKGRDIPLIVYERHQFWRELVKRGIDPRTVLQNNSKAAQILAQTPYSRYGRFITQYSRRDLAIEINREAAFAACSYGGFQIMGYWFAECGYKSPEEFAEAMTDSNNHIPAFVKLVTHFGLAESLRQRDFATFAEGWNGPLYYKKGYHIELARIYQRELAASLPRHESKLAAAVQSGTVQRGAAVVLTGVAPTAPVLVESDSLSNLISTMQNISDKGQDLQGQLQGLQATADSLAPLLEWLPVAAGGWTVLLLIIFGLLVHRYLRDRGYVA